jgi:hypothetical protein
MSWSQLTWNQGGIIIIASGIATLALIIGTLVTGVLRGRPLPSQEEVEDAIRKSGQS